MEIKYVEFLCVPACLRARAHECGIMFSFVCSTMYELRVRMFMFVFLLVLCVCMSVCVFVFDRVLQYV
jgi:hypothetical protein